MAYIPICSFCKVAGERHEKHDACYCPSCGIWLEKVCSDPRCEFCANRPELISAREQGGTDGD